MGTFEDTQWGKRVKTHDEHDQGYPTCSGDLCSERRLAALLSADIVGYSRLLGHDEVGMVTRVDICRSRIVRPAVPAHGGRLVTLVGDGGLVDFPSAANAVKCAVEWQDAMTSVDEGVSVPLVFRIGISPGDVIAKNGDVFGEGVNVSARLEPMTDPGGIPVSGDVQAAVQGRVTIGPEGCGEQRREKH
jgi:class 3 adenylate cyclase